MKNTFRYGAGAVAGALLALGGVGIGGSKLFPEQKPQVQVKLVEKRVEVPVEKKVYVTRKVKEFKVYRVVVTGDDGKATTFNDITKFQFRIIGAVLTNKAGQTFSVDGDVSVEPIK